MSKCVQSCIVHSSYSADEGPRTKMSCTDICITLDVLQPVHSNHAEPVYKGSQPKPGYKKI